MNENKDNELDLMKFYLVAVALKNLLFSAWKSILLTGFVCGLLGILFAWWQPKTYIAELSFATEEKSAANSFSNLAGQLGLDLMGKIDGGAFRGENLIEVFTSQLVIEDALLQEVEINGKSQVLVNNYLEFTHYYDSEKAQHDNIRFVEGQARETFSRAQDSLLHVVSNGLKKNNISISKLDKKLSIYKLVVTSESEVFAKVLCETLSKSVYGLYTDLKTRQTRKNIQLMQLRLDSLKIVLEYEMYSAANMQDRNQNAALTRVRVPYMKQQVNIQFLTTMFVELTKNLELLKMNLVKEEPIIQVLDRPIPPLQFEKYSKLICGILFSIVGSLLMGIWIICRVLYRSIQERKTFVEMCNP